MRPFVWDEWPQYFRGRLRAPYELTGEVRYRGCWTYTSGLLPM